MRYAILLQQRKDGAYEALVPALPGLTSVGETRDGTLQAVRRAITEKLTTAELVYLDIPDQAAAATNPWLATAGMFAGDPTLEPMLQDIYVDRDMVEISHETWKH
jgi:predicted RNase H-like HicB family nuclease